MRRILLGGLIAMSIGDPAAAQTSLPTRRTLTLHAARSIAAAAESEARKNNWAVAIAALPK